MASLNLIPNPSVLAVQAGVFMANVVVVKKLFVDPYLKVRDARDNATQGSKEEADRLYSKSETLAEEIQQKITQASAEARQTREGIRQDAIAKRRKIMQEAESEARQKVDEVEQRIKSELAEQQKRIPEIVGQLTDEVYSATVS